MVKTSYKLIVVVGDVDESTAAKAKEIDCSAFLINYKNCHEFLQTTLQKDTVVYTSLGDIPDRSDIMWELLNCADTVIYNNVWHNSAPVDVESPSSSVQGTLENLLLQLPTSIEVLNFDTLSLATDPNPVVSTRASESEQLWFAGCSITNGDGVDLSQRYGTLVADELQMPCSFLSKTASSISWAADQILRADVRPGDTVVWGLTSAERLTFFQNQQCQPITVNSYKVFKNLESDISIKNLFTQNTFFHHLYSIKQVINFCKISNIKLYIIGLLTSPSCIRQLVNEPTFYQFPYNPTQTKHLLNFIDLGTDNCHPGPNQHKQYKDFIVSLINKI